MGKGYYLLTETLFVAHLKLRNEASMLTTIQGDTILSPLCGHSNFSHT